MVMKILRNKILRHRRLWIAVIGVVGLFSTLYPNQAEPLIALLDVIGMELGTITGGATGVLALDSLIRPKKGKEDK